MKKTLFISLLRFGDLFMHMILIEKYVKQNPEEEIHILVNDMVKSDIEKLFSKYVFHKFYRMDFEKQINRMESPLLFPLYKLKSDLEKLNKEKFDKVIDLTYQKLSTSVLNLIESPFKSGVFSWEPFRSSNDFVIKDFINKMHNPKINTHYIDLLSKTFLKSDSSALDIDYKTEENKYKGFDIFKSPLVLFQVSTSDYKKSYDLSKWSRIIHYLKFESGIISKKVRIKILSSRLEYKLLSQHFDTNDLFAGDFYQVHELLKKADLLVSLDTSIKHLAVFTGIPILELSIGSSHPYKTAAYNSKGTDIISSSFHCRPCSHSKECIYSNNKCQDEINESQIIKSILIKLKGDFPWMETESQL